MRREQRRLALDDRYLALQTPGRGEREQDACDVRSSRDQSPSKWWHVSDGQIDHLIRQLNSPEEGGKLSNSQGDRTKPSPSARRERSASEAPTWQRSVRFSDGAPTEDSLDQALRESNDSREPLRESNESKSNENLRHDSREPPRKRGSWKTSDKQLLDFIQNAKKVLNNTVEEETAEEVLEGSFAGGYPTASSASIPKCSYLQRFDKQLHQETRDPRAPAKAGYGRPRRDPSKNDLSIRPTWAKSSSMPNLLASKPTKGQRVLKPGVCKYEETPIYLSDKNDGALERVRVAVCGHPYYMGR